ncbi:MAG: T9SS type A sorting domain-containing protein [Sedimentisphaerales bacterium]|nr:T9SS type A sorting domain-containing protein [Sedimentisphaerales bacterium]
MTRNAILSLILIITILVIFNNAQAEWQLNGNVICNDTEHQKNPFTVPDELGGAIIIWESQIVNSDIYAQRIDETGNILWGSDHIILNNALSYKVLIKAVSDDNGGAIALWMELTHGYLYVQRINSEGLLQWGAEGVLVSNSGYWQRDADCISDGLGGVFVVWKEDRGDGHYNLFGQRIDKNGIIHWYDNGINVCGAIGNQEDPTIVSDNSGGVIVAWRDWRNGDIDIFGLRIDQDGNRLWTPNGVAIVNGPDNQWLEPAVSDGVGGAYISWSDENELTGRDVYAQRINSDGAKLWGADGLVICNAIGYQSPGYLVRTSDGNMILAWNDDRFWNTVIFAQKVSSGGSILWTSGGVLVSSYFDASNNHNIPSLTLDNSGGAIIAWEENDTGNIFVENIGDDGEKKFNFPIVSSSLGQVENVRISSDGEGGGYVSWAKESKDGDLDIYMQKVGADGEYPKATPSISAVEDIYEDEGGWVDVRVNASAYDVVTAPITVSYPITGYNVWRKAGISVAPTGYLQESETKNITNVQDKLLNENPIRLTAMESVMLGFPYGEWESLGFHVATQSEQYSFVVPTKHDSTLESVVYETFIVTAHTDYSNIYFFSEQDSGYSVDNLPPSKPISFEGEQITYPSGLNLTWDANSEIDISHYELFRGTSHDFEPNPENRIAVVTQSFFLDSEWSPNNIEYYKLCAVDRHGNISEYGFLMPEEIVASLLQSSSISRVGSTIKIFWTLSSLVEIQNLRISRINAEDSDIEILNNKSIKRDELVYSFIDQGGIPGNSYKYRVETSDEGTNLLLFETNSVSIPEMPLSLSQNHPNPFNPSTTISFYLPESEKVSLEIYNVEGKRVRTLCSKPYNKGQHKVIWNGLDDSGALVNSGIYFYKLKVGKETISKKMVLLR